MKKCFLLFLLIASSSFAEPVKIGFISPLTGSRSSNGEDARKGASLALEDLGEAASKLEIVYEDSQADPKMGVSAFQKLSSEGIKIFITQNSNISIPILELSQRAKALQVAISTTSDKYSTEGDLALRVNGPAVYEARAMAEFIAAHPGKLSILTMQDEYPVILQKSLVAELHAKNIIPAVSEDFAPQENDFRAIVTKVKNSKVIACLGYQVQCGLLVKQLREAKSDSIIVVNTPVNSREFFATAGKAAEGTFAIYPSPDYQHPAARKFEERYGYRPDFFSASAYDAVILTGRALVVCNESSGLPDCMYSEIMKNAGYKGLSGVKALNPLNGDMSDNYSVLIARSGKFEQNQ